MAKAGKRGFKQGKSGALKNEVSANCYYKNLKS